MNNKIIILPTLNQSQQQAAEAPSEGPLLVIAGAGSGKTTALTARLLTLLKRGINPSNIIAITFTNKAALEMKNRIFSAISPSSELFVGTFHSFGARLLRRHASLLERTAAFSIYDQDDSRRLFRLAFKNLNIKREHFSPAIIAARLSRTKNNLENWRLLSESSRSEDHLAAEIFIEYERLLKEHNAFDFDDLLLGPVHLLRSYPNLLLSYRRRWRYFLVDEYQDVNPAQYTLIRLLVGDRGNLSVVGDDQQAIYSFRGADFRNFLNFGRDFPSARIVKLEKNYRSTKNIIAAANSLISHNINQHPKHLFTDNPSGRPVHIVEHKDEEAEAAWLTQKISTYSPLRPSTILYRTNAQSRALEQSLIEAGLSYEILGGLRFYDRREIKDLVAALRFSLNPRDRLSLTRLYKNFYRAPFRLLEEKLPAHSDDSPASLLRFIVESTDYFSQLSRQTDNSEERIANIEELISFAESFSNLPSFIEKISLFESSEARPYRQTSELVDVNLMTIHLSKGLEFDRVFVAGCSEGFLPHERSLANNNEIEEERRLLYVAMTRAKQELTLSFFGLPSRFLSEISSDFVDFSISNPLNDEERYILI